MKARVPPAEMARLNPDRFTEPFWQAATEHRLVCARCVSCGTFRMPPAPRCHECQAADVDYVDLPGTGIVYSFTVIHKAVIPTLGESVPYAVAVVELDGAPGTRLVTNLVDIEIEEISIGMRVEVAWDDVAPDVTLPRFRASR